MIYKTENTSCGGSFITKTWLIKAYVTQKQKSTLHALTLRDSTTFSFSLLANKTDLS